MCKLSGRSRRPLKQDFRALGHKIPIKGSGALAYNRALWDLESFGSLLLSCQAPGAPARLAQRRWLIHQDQQSSFSLLVRTSDFRLLRTVIAMIPVPRERFPLDSLGFFTFYKSCEHFACDVIGGEQDLL